MDIKILDDYQRYFGCKKKQLYSNEDYYTIVRSNGQEIGDIGELECGRQFVYVDDSHIITSIGGKYGFINLLGQKVVPFKYDEIIGREDGNYNARINNRWGILSIEGREITHIKYSSPLPKDLGKSIIVKDAESECFGIVDSNGVESIPTVYEQLMSSEDDNLFYYGCGGFEDEDHPTFFSSDINGAMWGVVSRNGRKIIDAKYLNYKIKSNYIVAGRDGGYFPDNDDDDYSWYGSNFDGVYDLYNKDGELLIGGFTEFEYDEHNGLFIFFFGGEWKEYSVYDDDWNNIHITGYKFERGNDLWLILDKNLKTIMRDKNNNAKQFSKGFIGHIEIKKEEKKTLHIYNMPIDLMAKGFSHVAINSVIINNSNSEYHQSQAVDIATGRKTKLYSKIEQITNFLFFFADGDKVGITNIESEHFIENCLFITNPIDGYLFIPKEKVGGTYDVFLYSIDNLKEPITTAITDVSKEDLINLVNGHWLKMDYDESMSGLKSLVIPRSRFLLKEFLDLVSTKEETDHKLFSHNNDNDYFFSNDYHFSHDILDNDFGSDYGDMYSSYDPSDAFDGEPDAYWNID